MERLLVTAVTCRQHGRAPLRFAGVGIKADNAIARQAAAARPLQSVPLAVVAQGQSWGAPEALSGFPPEAFDSAWRAAQVQLATLVPNARLFVASESGHFIQLDQPEVVTEAIRQVVAGVRDPDTWDDLACCCAKAVFSASY